MHAEIRYHKRGYVIEDHRSHNGTMVNGSELQPGQAHELEPESQVKFGAIDAVFVIDSDSAGQKVPAQQHHRALDLLVEAGMLSAKRRTEIVEEYEGRRGACSPIELLLREGVDAASWSLAFRGKLTAKKKPWKWIWMRCGQPSSRRWMRLTSLSVKNAVGLSGCFLLAYCWPVVRLVISFWEIQTVLKK